MNFQNMQKLIHSIQLNVFEKNENEVEKIINLYHVILPIDFKKEKIQIQHKKLEGLQKQTIHSLSLQTNKKRHNMLLLKTILDNLDEKFIEQLNDQIESRLSDEGYFFIRLDKPLLLNDTYVLTDKGNCLHIKIKIAGYPAKRSSYLKSIKILLNNYKEYKK
jgi:RNA binding exosome subunit